MGFRDFCVLDCSMKLILTPILKGETHVKKIVQKRKSQYVQVSG